MVFLAEKKVTIPTKDLLSWIFDDVPYDQHEPVSFLSNKATEMFGTAF
jgi:hypothetical protein